MPKQKIRVDVVSDVMCPWCYIGKKHLEAAIKITSELDVEVHWRPYQLDATLPLEGKNRQQYLNDKFGGQERANEIYSNIEAAGKEAGLNFKFDLIKLSPNTLKAHRLLKWAADESLEIQNALVTRLFDLFFIEGQDIGNNNILIDAAKNAGMNIEKLDERLNGDEDKEPVIKQIAQAQQMGVTGVPCFIIDLKHGIAGAQPPQALAQTLRQIASA